MVRYIKIVTVVIVLVVAALLARVTYRVAYHPLLSEPAVSTTIKVPPGTGIYRLSRQLKSQGLLAHPYWFSTWAKVSGQAKALKAGEYRVHPGMSATDLLKDIVNGKVVHWPITFIEGWTFREFKETLKENPHVTHTIESLSDQGIMEKLGHPNQHPEGLFFPDTYYFIWGDTDIDILKRAYKEMEETLTSAWSERAPHLPYKNKYQALIVASLIEKETAIKSERKKVAGVIVRRLEKRMRLQVDPTVLYGLGKPYSAPITRSDLKKKTPYNTYQRYGLPPTPIDMPSRSSIIAAMHPASGKSLYYMSRGDGSHTFSETYSEHTQAVKRYRDLAQSRKAFEHSSQIRLLYHLLLPWINLIRPPTVCFYGLHCYYGILPLGL